MNTILVYQIENDTCRFIYDSGIELKVVSVHNNGGMKDFLRSVPGVVAIQHGADIYTQCSLMNTTYEKRKADKLIQKQKMREVVDSAEMWDKLHEELRECENWVDAGKRAMNAFSRFNEMKEQPEENMPESYEYNHRD